MKLAKALSRRIKTLRESTGLSQQEVATKGDLSVSLVAKLEQGKKADPRTSTVLALATALGVSPGQLLNDLFPPAEPPPEPPPPAELPEAEKPKKKDKKKKKVKEKEIKPE